MRPLPAADLEHVLTHGAELWPRLAGARLFVTGATGFFGKWLLECLLHASDCLQLDTRITALSRRPAAFAAAMPHLAGHPALSWQSGDVGSFAFPQGRFTHIIHAATEASAALNRERPLVMFDTIVAGTRRVLDFAVAAGVADLLLTSSGAVYGRQPPEMERIPEIFAGGPDPNTATSAYAEGKRAAEQLCAIYARQHDLAPRIARCFAFVGPHLPLDSHFAAGNFLGDALAGREILIQGDGTPFRSYLYAADMTIWLLKILFDGQPNRPYNVGSDEAVDIAGLARQVAATVPGTARVRVLGSPCGLPAERYVPDVERARSELGLRVAIPLSQALSRSVGWHTFAA